MSRKEEPGPGAYSLMDILTTEQGILRLGHARAIVMTEAAFIFLLRVLHEHAPHIVKYALYDMGFRVGEQIASTRPVEAEPSEDEFRYFIETYNQSGYGDLEVVEFQPSAPRVHVRGTRLLESSAARQSNIYGTPRAVDHYSRGLLAGLISSMLGRQMIGEEIACEFRGDPCCEFVVLPLESEE